jgi:putative restriction endonuclease
LVADTQAQRFGDGQLELRTALTAAAFLVLFPAATRTRVVSSTDAYERRCAITGERTLPVLEAAHIKPYGSGGPHELENGLLLRSDLHTLFDQGYLTVDADQLKVVVSSRIREEFENGRDYYHLHGRAIRLPRESDSLPSHEYLAFHNSVFR